MSSDNNNNNSVPYEFEEEEEPTNSNEHWSASLRRRDPALKEAVDVWRALYVLRQRPIGVGSKKGAKTTKNAHLAAIEGSGQAVDDSVEESNVELLIQWLPPVEEMEDYPSRNSAQFWCSFADLFSDRPHRDELRDVVDELRAEIRARSQAEEDSSDEEVTEEVEGESDESSSSFRLDPELDEYHDHIPLAHAKELWISFSLREMKRVALKSLKSNEDSGDLRQHTFNHVVHSSISDLMHHIGDAAYDEELLKQQYLLHERTHMVGEDLESLRDELFDQTGSRSAGRRRAEIIDRLIVFRAEEAAALRESWRQEQDIYKSWETMNQEVMGKALLPKGSQVSAFAVLRGSIDSPREPRKFLVAVACGAILSLWSLQLGEDDGSETSSQRIAYHDRLNFGTTASFQISFVHMQWSAAGLVLFVPTGGREICLLTVDTAASTFKTHSLLKLFGGYDRVICCAIDDDAKRMVVGIHVNSNVRSPTIIEAKLDLPAILEGQQRESSIFAPILDFEFGNLHANDMIPVGENTPPRGTHTIQVGGGCDVVFRFAGGQGAPDVTRLAFVPGDDDLRYVAGVDTKYAGKKGGSTLLMKFGVPTYQVLLQQFGGCRRDGLSLTNNGFSPDGALVFVPGRKASGPKDHPGKVRVKIIDLEAKRVVENIKGPFSSQDRMDNMYVSDVLVSDHGRVFCVSNTEASVLRIGETEIGYRLRFDSALSGMVVLKAHDEDGDEDWVVAVLKNGNVKVRLVSEIMTKGSRMGR